MNPLRKIHQMQKMQELGVHTEELQDVLFERLPVDICKKYARELLSVVAVAQHSQASHLQQKGYHGGRQNKHKMVFLNDKDITILACTRIIGEKRLCAVSMLQETITGRYEDDTGQPYNNTLFQHVQNKKQAHLFVSENMNQYLYEIDSAGEVIYYKKIEEKNVQNSSLMAVFFTALDFIEDDEIAKVMLDEFTEEAQKFLDKSKQAEGE